MYHSTFSSKAHRVSIIIHKNIPFQHLSTKPDINGRYLIVTGTVLEEHVTFVNLYAPYFDEQHFFRSVLISFLISTPLILLLEGTLIVYWTLLWIGTPKPSNSATVCNNLIQLLNILDIWRLHHPNVHNSNIQGLTDFKLTFKIISSKYHNILISDHSPVSIQVDFGMVDFGWVKETNILCKSPMDTIHFSFNDKKVFSTFWMAG